MEPASRQKSCQERNSLGAIWGFPTAKDRNLRIGRIRKCRKSFRISVRLGFDSQALPPAYRTGRSAAAARLPPLNPHQALVPTEPFVSSLSRRRLSRVALADTTRRLGPVLDAEARDATELRLVVGHERHAETARVRGSFPKADTPSIAQLP